MDAAPTIVPLGDEALLVTFAHAISWDVGVAVRAAARRIRALQLEAVTEVVPAYTTLAIHFDGSRATAAALAERIAPAIASADDTDDVPSATIEIPVTYDGPDLVEVADRTGLGTQGVIERHAGRTYRAYACGFQPGFAYLGDLDDRLVLPRRATPRVRVPRGSVAIAGAQTGVYPLDTPGGWHLIGRTAAVMFDARRDPPALIRPGDLVRFVRVDR